MHEFSIIQSIFKLLEDIAEQNKLIKINKVILRIGKLRQVVHEFLQFAFEQISSNTIAESAKLIIEEIPIKMKCETCKHEFAVERNTYICPKCEAVKLTVLTGKEIMIASIDGETSEDEN